MASETEIANLHDTLWAQEKIVRLQVSVEDPLRVQVLNSLQQLWEGDL